LLCGERVSNEVYGYLLPHSECRLLIVVVTFVTLSETLPSSTLLPDFRTHSLDSGSRISYNPLPFAFSRQDPVLNA
jgi:hypothetical protein